VYHWNGGAWSEVETGAGRRLIAIWGGASADLWAVGEAGAILFHP